MTIICCLALLTVAAQPVLSAPSGRSKLSVVVSILPQEWFIEQIGGDLVDSSVLVGPGHSPATFEPTPKQIAELQGADLFIAAGVPFERGLVPRIKAMRDGPRLCGPESAGTDDHDHHEIDPHTWLDPRQALVMADTMCAEMCRLAPASADQFQARLADLKVRLDTLDRDLRAELGPYQGREFFVFHPAFGHFAAAYGLTQVAVEDHGHEPGPQQLAAVIDLAKAKGARAIIVQPQFSQKSAGTVARAADLEVVALDPLSSEYDANLRHIASVLADLFARTGEAPK